jgi:hypothetical protein
MAMALSRQGREEEADGWWQRAIEAAGHPAEARMLAKVRRSAAGG